MDPTPATSLHLPPPPDLMPRLADLLRRGLDQAGWRFSCEGSEFSAEEVTAVDGLLPLWIHRAQAWMAKSLGGQAGHMAYRIDGAALCGVRPEANAPTAGLAVWACYAHYAIEEWRGQHAELVRKGKPVPLDALYQDWHAVIQARQVPLLPPHPMPTAQMDFGPAQATGLPEGQRGT